MRREILMWPHPTLCGRAEEVGDRLTSENEAIRFLVREMEDTCRAAHGLGLAAPQVGVAARIVILDVGSCELLRPRLITMIDPVLSSFEGEQESIEGCLSIPNESGTILRAETCTVTYRTLDSASESITGKGLLACALQHEIDHLDGKVFLDHLPSLKRSQTRRRMVKLQKQIRRGQVELKLTTGGFRL